MNTYRVDRNDNKDKTPLGMNTLLYMGDSVRQAQKAFNDALTGYDGWNQKNASYGVTLAVWDKNKQDYKIIQYKGL